MLIAVPQSSRDTAVSLQSTVARAVRWHRQGQFDRAEPVYREVLAQQPGNPDALHFPGLLLQGMLVEARKPGSEGSE